VGAIIIKVDQFDDLALLSPQSPIPVPFLHYNKMKISTYPDITVFGYPLNLRVPNTDRGKLGTGASTIDEAIPLNNDRDRLIGELHEVGFPDLNADIIPITLKVNHGYSGGPLIDDSSSEVIGIVDGGIENGVIGLNWCIPSSKIAKLLLSKEDVDAISSRKIEKSHIVFSYDYCEAVNSKTVTSSNSLGTFSLTRSRSLKQLANNSEVQLGMRQIISAFPPTSPEIYENFAYDIYEDAAGGALVVPKGVNLLSANNGNFIGTQGDCQIFIYKIPINFDNVQSDQAKFLAANEKVIEREKGIISGDSWVINPAFTAMFPTNNGSMLVKKCLVNQVPPGKVAFETLMMGSGYAVGVVAINNNFSALNIDESNRLTWMRMVLGIHFSMVK
jgi:hypothetical protein